MQRLGEYTRELEQRSAGVLFAQRAIALALGVGNDGPAKYAERRWGSNSITAREIKMAAVAGGTSADAQHSGLPGTNLGESEFFDSIRPLEVISRLPLRRVPPHVPVIAQTGGATATWTSEGRAVPLSRTAFDRTAIVPLSAPAMVVYSNSLLDDSSPVVEEMIANDLRRACIEASDRAFADATNAGVIGRVPRSVAYDAPSLPSSGSIQDDVGAAIEVFEGDLRYAAWLMSPQLAARMALTMGLSSDRLGARGGELVGIPCITSQACAFDSSGGTIVLLDASAIAIADMGVSIERSTNATVEMDGDPQANVHTPTAMSAHVVSLFATDSTALLVCRLVNWHVGHQNAVVKIVNAVYEGGS